MRIALVNSTADRVVGLHAQDRVMPPLGLQVLAQRTPPGHDLRLYDQQFAGESRFPADLASGMFDLVAVSTMTCGAPRAYEMAALCRDHGVPCIIGGIHASMCPDEAAEHFDAVATGECDHIWADILADAANGTLKRRYEGGLAELTGDVGFADAHLVPVDPRHRYQLMGLQTSRGCPGGCTYCSVTRFNGPRIRHRPVDSVVEEWNAGPKRPMTFVTDDNFFGVSSRDVDRSKALCEALIRRGRRRLWFTQTSLNAGRDIEALKLAYRAGCRVVAIGFESFSPDVLAWYGKGTNQRAVGEYRELIAQFHRAGLAVYGMFILGADHDTADSVGQTVRMVHDVGVDVWQLACLAPLPGTALFEQMRRQERLRFTDYPNDWQYYRAVWSAIVPKQMTAKELDMAMDRAREIRRGDRWLALRQSVTALRRTRSITTALVVGGFTRAMRQMAMSMAHSMPEA